MEYAVGKIPDAIDKLIEKIDKLQEINKQLQEDFKQLSISNEYLSNTVDLLRKTNRSLSAVNQNLNEKIKVNNTEISEIELRNKQLFHDIASVKQINILLKSENEELEKQLHDLL